MKSFHSTLGISFSLTQLIYECWKYAVLKNMFSSSSRMVDFKVQQRRYRTNEKIIVSTTYGPIKGVKRKTIYGDSYYSFEGIPFAKPPLGDLRYKAPLPPDSWTDVRSCTSVGPKPLQKHFVFQMTEGSEDCLYLNVYTKNVRVFFAVSFFLFSAPILIRTYIELVWMYATSRGA